MAINVSEGIDRDTGAVITVIRTAPLASGTEYVDGIFQKGTESTFKAVASVQQPTPEDLNMLPEGDRNKDIKVFYCNKRLLIGRDRSEEQVSQIADRISFQGIEYKIIMLADWILYGHNIGFGARV